MASSTTNQAWSWSAALDVWLSESRAFSSDVLGPAARPCLTGNTEANTHIQQVLRYVALGSGLLYGYFHNATLHKAAEGKRAEAAYATKEQLIKKAKAAYAQSKLPASQKTGDGKIVPDWENGSNLDDYFKQLDAEA
ncbi:hypothetical protein BCR37DRAFT_392983 [Protomyces lactucae-debilis]|uniref:ATP synthase F(0) complex subunit e, mitochondrial n=1 Tax=Protomyces lactucae-debilis TaxID=2754530 RepID=A0A1Y2FDD4_PROLT|nr:uncharacterized protein BCR37DRAFT_392983 [Protomyces lactucae-debilis]ORY81938.1 hypothetical protein BCR37DRAFT_392983 [Protomyces lactucae-debilis]